MEDFNVGIEYNNSKIVMSSDSEPGFVNLTLTAEKKVVSTQVPIYLLQTLYHSLVNKNHGLMYNAAYYDNDVHTKMNYRKVEDGVELFFDDTLEGDITCIFSEYVLKSILQCFLLEYFKREIIFMEKSYVND